MSDQFSPDPEAPILVIGSAGLDLVGRLQGEWLSGTSAPARIRSSLGGVARNVAENIARLGHPVSLISVVGEDPEGVRILEQARAAGVDTSGILCSAEHSTGLYLAVLDEQGALKFGLDDMGAIDALTSDYIRQCEARFKAASLIFVDANIPKKTLRTVMSLARKAGRPVCADPTSVVLASRLRPYLPRIAMLCPNGSEAAELLESSFNFADPAEGVDAAKRLVAAGAGTVIITLGERGLCYATSQLSGYIPAVRTEILDPTGAGDALCAAVMVARLNNIPLDDAVRLGVAAASLTLRYRGTVYPDISLEMLYEFI